MIKRLQHIIQQFLSQGHARSIKAKKNVLGLLTIKGSGIAISFFLVPLTINYVKPFQYGIWITLSSLVAWLNYFDIGFGHGLRNKFSEALANGETEKARIYVSTTYFSMGAVIGLMFILFFIINPFLNWANILNTKPEMASELSILALTVFVFFCLQFVFQLLSTILTANHEPAKASLLQTLGSFISLLIIYVLTKTTSGNLLYLGAVLSATPVMVMGIASIWFYKTSYKEFSPSFRLFKLGYVRDLMGLGIQFFIINISFLVMLNTDNIVIAQLLGPEKVTVFNVAYKLFTMISMIFLIIVTPLWSAYTDAYTKKEFDWIKKTLKATQKIWLLLVGLTLIVLLISPWFFKLWLGDSVHVPFTLSVAMTTYVIAYIWMTIYAILLNGMGKIRLQLYLATLSGIIYIPLVIYFGKILGLEGITYLSTVFFIFTGIIYSIQIKKLLNRTAIGLWDK